MSSRSLQEQIETLLQKRIVEGRTRGTSNPQLEASALFESIALSLILKPKSVLYVATLATNGLLRAATTEVGAIDNLKKTVQDLRNVSYDVRDVSALQKARTAIVEAQGLNKISSQSPAFKKFVKSVDAFLKGSIGKNVRRPGIDEMVRPGSEAADDLATDLESLKTAHEEFLDRVYALSVGVENFHNSSYRTLLGLDIASKIQDDLESIIEDLDISSLSSRDAVIRLIADKSALQQLNLTSDLYDSSVVTMESLPQVPIVTTDELSSVSLTGEWSVNGSSSYLPVAGVDVGLLPFIVGDALRGQDIEVPADSYLFIKVATGPSSETIRIAPPLGPTSPAAFADWISNHSSNKLLAVYLPNTRRILVYGDFESIAVVPYVLESTNTTSRIQVSFTNSYHNLLGFRLGTGEARGPKSLELLRLSIEEYFSDRVAVDRVGGRIVLTGLDASPGASLVIHAPGLSLNGTYPATSKYLVSASTVPAGAELQAPSWSAKVVSSGAPLTLDYAVPTFSGEVTVTNPLVTYSRSVDEVVQSFITTWLKTDYSKGLSSLDRLFAALIGDRSSANVGAAISALEDLSNYLTNLIASLSAIPKLIGADEEREVVRGIVESLEERGFDRAANYLLSCKIQELFEMDSETASYGGALMKSMSDLAQADIDFPNTALDDYTGTKGYRRLGS